MRNFPELFKGRNDMHGALIDINFNKIGRDGKYTKESTFVYKAPVFDDHLKGKQKIGIIPFVENDRCHFGAVDIDEYKNFDHKQLIQKLRDKKIPGVVTRSTNGGAHIWFFFNNPVRSSDLKSKLKAVRQELGYDADGEVFPKQKVLKEGGKGNYIYLPYYGKGLDVENKKWTNECDTYGFNDEGKKLLLEEFEEYANEYVIDDLLEMNVNHFITPINAPVPAPVNVNPNANINDELSKNGPPCLNTLWNLPDSKKLGDGDHRNNAMFSYGIFVRQVKGEVSRSDLDEFNETFANKLGVSELNVILKQMKKPEFFYRCEESPLNKKGVCNRDLCLMKKHGIGNFSSDVSYYNNFQYVKDDTRIVKMKPTAVLLRVEEAKTLMLVEKGMVQKGRNQIAPGQEYLQEVARSLGNWVDVQEWHPGKPTFYTKKGHHGEVKVYNAYKPTLIKPIEGDVSIWEDFMEKRFHKNPVFRIWFEDFLAHKIQRPDVRTHSNIILISNWGGTGKSLIDEIMQELLGQHNCASISLDDISGTWADIVMNKVWISVEEVHDTGANRKKIAAIIKRLTTIKNMFGNMKYGKFRQADIYASLYFMSNEETALSIKKADRRPAVYNMDNDGRAFIEDNEAEGTMLKEWCEVDQGYEKLLNYFQKRDISKFDSKKLPPQTKAKALMVRKTHEYFHQALLDAIDTMSWPLTGQCQVYAPKTIAGHLKMKEEEVIEIMEENLGIKKLMRVHNCEWIVKDNSENKKMDMQVDESRQKIQLWANDEKLLAQKEAGTLKPKECLKYYLHPTMHGQRKVFAQDNRVDTNLVRTLNSLDHNHF